MTEINLHSEEIKEQSRYGRLSDAFVRVREEGFMFSTAAEKICEIKENEYMHFLNDGSEWHFYTSDNKDGFLISVRSKGKGGSYVGRSVCSHALVRLFRKSTGFTHAASFKIEKTNIIHDKCNVFKIDTVKPIK